MRRPSVLSFAAAALLCVLSAPALVSAHVRLLYTNVPIRNAASATANGAYSVAGPCGGVLTYGIRGVTEWTSEQNVELTIGYNGGHQDAKNAFHVTYYCAPDGQAVNANTAEAALKGLPNANAITLLDGRATVPAVDSLTSGYKLAFKLPAVTAASNCVFSVMDQRNWGGCVDVKLLPKAAPSPTPTPTPTPSPAVISKTPCESYCNGITANCTGSNTQYNSTTPDCLSSCAAMSTAGAAGDLTGNSLQCRAAHLALASSPSAAALQCPHAGRVGQSGGCVDSEAEAAARLPSPCAQYCAAVAANCASSRFFADEPACLRACAGFAVGGLGSDASPPGGDNLACRLSSAQSATTCAAAAPRAAGLCAQTDPLIVADDTLSAVYGTLASQCEAPAAAAANTISGCCCLSGTATLIRVRGSRLATLSTNLTVSGGDMCRAGRNISVPNYLNPAAAPSYYDFATNVTVTQLDLALLRQVRAGSADLAATVTIGGDRFDLLLMADADGLPLLTLTNDVDPTQKPRVCSTAARSIRRIDSTGMTPPKDPNDDDDDDLGAAATVGADVGMRAVMVAAAAAFVLAVAF